MTKAQCDERIKNEHEKCEARISIAENNYRHLVESLNALLFRQPLRSGISRSEETGREAILVRVAELLAYKLKNEGAVIAGEGEIQRLNALVRIALEDPTLKCEKEHVFRGIEYPQLICRS